MERGIIVSESIFDKIPDKIGFFGLGKSNLALIGRLPKGKRIVIRSDKEIPELPRTEAEIVYVKVGKVALDEPFEEILFLSPSVRRDRKELLRYKQRGVKLTSDCEFFFENATSPVFAVSGSDGKSTTTVLTSLLLKERFVSCPAIGNIGVPMTPTLSERHGAYALELSSFMLSYGRYRFFRGALTNLCENHLDWHKDFDEYKEAKLSVIKRAREAVISADDGVCREYLSERSVYGIFSSEIPYSELKRNYRAEVYYTLEDGYIKRCGENIISTDSVKRNEKHNIKNLLAALTLTEGYASRERIRRVAEEFSGLSHRMEHFYSTSGIDFIDSSIDSTPNRTSATLFSLDKRVVLILGGRGKGLSYEPLYEPIKKYAKAVILAGENSEEIKEALPKDIMTLNSSDLSDAVEISKNILSEGDTLLLSPASTSYDAFTDFSHRGEFFKAQVKKVFKNKV